MSNQPSHIRELSLTILSKMLYAVAERSIEIDKLKNCHRKLMGELTEVRSVDDSKSEETCIYELPWMEILDSIMDAFPTLKYYKGKGIFSCHEIRYMCALMCGLSGKEYGLISGFRSHYNLSLAIRHKLGMTPKSTNLRNHLQQLLLDPSHQRIISPRASPKA